MCSGETGTGQATGGSGLTGGVGRTTGGSGPSTWTSGKTLFRFARGFGGRRMRPHRLSDLYVDGEAEGSSRRDDDVPLGFEHFNGSEDGLFSGALNGGNNLLVKGGGDRL